MGTVILILQRIDVHDFHGGGMPPGKLMERIRAFWGSFPSFLVPRVLNIDLAYIFSTQCEGSLPPLLFAPGNRGSCLSKAATNNGFYFHCSLWPSLSRFAANCYVYVHDSYHILFIFWTNLFELLITTCIIILKEEITRNDCSIQPIVFSIIILYKIL